MRRCTVLAVMVGALAASSACTLIVAIDSEDFGVVGESGTAGGSGTSGGDGGVPQGGTGGGGGTGTCVQGQRILVDEVVNGRDLGGTPLADGARVACGKLYRAAAPANLSAQGCAEFARLGIRTVVDLRVDSEITAAPHSACVQEQASIILAPMPVPYNLSPQDYIADLDTTESVAAAFGALGDEAAYPVYFHCTYGRDRSGVLAAVVLLALGAAREDIMEEYQLTTAAGLTTAPASLEAVLDEIELRGGVEAYLDSAGVAAARLEVLRAQVIAR
jgi:protein tyrosine phosphatase (PTP) superfamily phosphohydrolase (DUF442 family)